MACNDEDADDIKVTEAALQSFLHHQHQGEIIQMLVSEDEADHYPVRVIVIIIS